MIEEIEIQKQYKNNTKTTQNMENSGGYVGGYIHFR